MAIYSNAPQYVFGEQDETDKFEEIMNQIMHARNVASAEDLSDDARRQRAMDVALQFAALLGDDEDETGGGSDSD